MNYRHDYHAGNFADVYKHAMLARILVHLARKDTPFQVIDTHAGPGLYQLHGEAVTRPQDRLLFGEMLPEDFVRLAAAMRGDRRIQVLETNGFVLLRARRPPP